MRIVVTFDTPYDGWDHPDQPHVMPLDPERVGDLVLHLGLIMFPRRDLGRHLALVVRVIPPVVRSVEGHHNAHAGMARDEATRIVVASGRGWEGRNPPP